MSSILAIIPARYASTRLPGKPLLKIGFQSMIELVYRQVEKCKNIDEIVVATDNELIFNHVKLFGGKVILTSEAHQSGTDRCWEAYQKVSKSFNYVINIQGDEPFIQPQQISELANLLKENVEIASLVKKIEDNETLFNINIPKVILNQLNEAIYFSRQTLPFLRGIEKDKWLINNTFYKHIGIYGYSISALKAIAILQQTPLEKAESLEQLRWIENGFKIKMGITTYDSMGIDTEADLLHAQNKINYIK